MDFTPQWPHGEISEIFADCFFVTGTNKLHHNDIDLQMSRNMVIIRHGSELTLINTVRLNDTGLQKLDSLGIVTHIVRIGAFHGRDDAFYRDRYPSSQVWALKESKYDNGLLADRELSPLGEMPFPECSLFVFETSALPEGVLLIERDGGILVTCDSIQNITEIDEFYNPITAKITQDQGLVTPANISPIWLGATHTTSADFERLLKTMKFLHLVTAHGEPMRDNAFEQVTASVERVFS